MGLITCWKAEQIPHQEFDCLLYQYSASLYRTNFDAHGIPILPSYSLYTYLTLGQAFCAFLGLLLLHASVTAIIKYIISNIFRTAYWTSKLRDVLANLTIPDAFRDFDEFYKDKEEKTPKEYRSCHSAVKREMLSLISLHFLTNILLLVPIMVTGEILR